MNWLLDWMPFLIVITLFLLAIIAPWVIPNKKVSNNKHDREY